MVVDLHSDLAIDLWHRRTAGERDVFRTHHLEPLRAAGIGVQVLAVWVPTPFLPELGLRQALRLIESIHREAEESEGALRIVTTTAELDAAIADGAIAGIISLEGVEALGRDADLLDTFWRLGVRMLGVTWNRATDFADGAVDDRGGGFTPVGRRLLERMLERNVALDLAHLAPGAIAEALATYEGHILASHANAAAVHASARNLADDVIAEVGRRNGVVGLNFLSVFAGDGDVNERLADHHDHIVRVAGPTVPACGADLVAFLPNLLPEGSVLLPADADLRLMELAEPPREEAYANLAAALRRRGADESAVAAMLSDNALTFLRRLLG